MSQRLWFKIGEAAGSAGVSPRELRYWEKVIPELRPRRSVGNLRYYHVDDLPKLCAIAAWVEQGFTVADCRELLFNGCIIRDLGLDMEEADAPDMEYPQVKAPPAAKSRSKRAAPPPDGFTETLREPMAADVREVSSRQLQDVIDSLKSLLTRLQKPIS